jgi:hypothetical protein
VEGNKVLCRTILNGSGGSGIVVARNPDQVVDAPLYSVYFRKNREYRIVFGHECGVVYVWSKRRPENYDGDRDDMLVRTLDRGWVYQREHEYPARMLGEVEYCASRLGGLGLNLLAYDVAYNSETDTACVIEANTAWGLNETTAELTYEAMLDVADALERRG